MLWQGEAAGIDQDTDALVKSFVRHFSHTLGRDIDVAAGEYLYRAVALGVRDRLSDRWRETRVAMERRDGRRTFYLSLEYLMGRAFSNTVANLGLDTEVREALHRLGAEIEEIAELETDAGLGNGGLGRLAACFLDSCASLGLPVMGYGIRYRYGMFRQRIENGWQVEQPDDWLARRPVWEIKRPELAQTVGFGGHVEVENGAADGRSRRRWRPAETVLAVPYDVPVPGHENGVVNTLRLWSANATHAFNLGQFNAGGYTEAVAEQTSAENISMVLYPNDASENGKILRLRQQYFLVSASLQDALRIWKHSHAGFATFAETHCFQLNDTHPSIAVAELMRLLIDEEDLEWDDAWSITTRVMAYTNHTLLPEALETWTLNLLRGLLPRIVEIIEEINRRFLKLIEATWPGDVQRQAEMSIISFDHAPVVRMAHLAIVGSFSVNGVAALHTELLKHGLFARFNELWPERFNNKTNGVTQRRWLALCNPGLATLLDAELGEGWLDDFERLGQIAPKAGDAGLQAAWQKVRIANKTRLAALVKQRTGIDVKSDMLFDVQVKRIHEYKRQLLCALHAVHCHLELRRGNDKVPRLILIGGKAAPGYHMAKAIIKLITSVADVINNDPLTQEKLKLVFFPDYNVSAMEKITPGADLSEQISTAGKEASGTGNMKFMMNGALTIGTLDGANVEIREAVGDENFFLFGHTVEEVEALRRDYDPQEFIVADTRLQAVFQAFDDGRYNGSHPDTIREVISAALSAHDPWMTVADLASYLDAQEKVEALWQQPAQWLEKSILNTAHSSRFSTDRTMREYNRDIWHLDPVGTV
ncbi:MAG: glycogen phosphorylase [Gammaproteobacteria bacterium]|nr:MAG: glycogen phosphorylase [Gammaproteobacteria bacterium]